MTQHNQEISGSITLSDLNWWDNDWTYRQLVTINTDQISLGGDISNDHPVLVKVDSSNTNFWSNVKNAGEDVRFIAQDGSTELKYHFEKFDHSSDVMIAWVKVTDTFRSASAMGIYMYYGNSDASDDQDEANTYPSAYLAAYHMNDADANVADSTGTYDGTGVNSPTNGATGKIGDCFSYNGSNEYHDLNAQIVDDNCSDESTVMMWIKRDNSDREDSLWGSYNAANGTYFIRIPSTDNYVRSDIRNSSSSYIATGDSEAVTGGTWFFICAVQDGSYNYIYVDAVEDNKIAYTNNLDEDYDEFLGAVNIQGSAGQFYDGCIDEVKIVNYGLSADEIKLIYNSENDNLLSFGGQTINPTLFDQDIEDSISLVDPSFTFLKNVSQTITDAITLQDSDYKDTFKTMSDALPLADAVVKDVAIVKSDSITLNDVLTKQFSLKDLVDSITLADSIIKGKAVDILDSIALVDSLETQSAINKNLSESITLNDSLTKQTIVDVLDSITLQDGTNKGYFQNVIDQLNLDDSIAKQIAINKNLEDSITLNDIINVPFKQTISGAITLVDVLRAGKAIELIDTITLSDTLTPELKEFLGDMQSDFANILMDVPFADDVTWKRTTDVTDEYGHVISSSNWSKDISLLIQPITEKDMDVLPKGTEVSGLMKAYASRRYYVSSSVGWKKVDEGDFISDGDGRKYIVQQVVGKYNAQGGEIYRKLLLRAVDND